MSKYRLLIIEDDQNLADLVCRVAAEIDFEVRTTCNFNQIADLYDEFTPHVIILDILMPGMDGFEVLNFLSKRHSPSRVVILSGHSHYLPMASKMAEGLKLIIAATIAKPFRLPALRQMLEKIKLSLPRLPNGNSSAAAA